MTEGKKSAIMPPAQEPITRVYTQAEEFMKIRLVILAAVIMAWIVAAVLLTQFGPQRKADEIAN